MIRYYSIKDRLKGKCTEIVFDDNYILTTPYEDTSNKKSDKNIEKYREYFYKQLHKNKNFRQEVVRLINLYEEHNHLEFYLPYRCEKCYADVVKECIFHYYKERLKFKY